MALDSSPYNILAILVEGHPKNISVKLFWNRAIGLEGDVV